jgi:hypothetical protein
MGRDAAGGGGMNSTANDLRKSLHETALSAGIPIISGDKCCRLLAWLYIYGGGQEQVVFDERLNTDIVYAQKRLNVMGGKIPDTELAPILQSYIKSVTDYGNPPEWVYELEKEYGIKAYQRNRIK